MDVVAIDGAKAEEPFMTLVDCWDVNTVVETLLVRVGAVNAVACKGIPVLLPGKAGRETSVGDLGDNIGDEGANIIGRPADFRKAASV